MSPPPAAGANAVRRPNAGPGLRAFGGGASRSERTRVYMLRRLFTAVCVGIACLAGGCAARKTDALTPAIQHVKADAAARLIATQQVTVLDIRTPKEFAAKHIAGAINIDFFARDFAARLDQLDRHQTYLLHCASGNRSRRALPTFEQLGFKRVVHLDGGILGWEAQGHPVTN